MGPTVPPRRDSRREPGFDEDEVPTDVTDRATASVAKPKLRFDTPAARNSDDPAHEQTEVGPLSSRRGVASAVLPRSLRAWLEVKSGPAVSASPIVLEMVRVAIGRGNQADIRIEDRKLSRKHLVIFYNGIEFRIRDAGSVNGTLLNGSNVGEYVLRDGDVVIAGNSHFVFHVTQAE